MSIPAEIRANQTSPSTNTSSLNSNMSGSRELMQTSDMLDISHVEIRDDLSYQMPQDPSNPTTVSLLRCKKQIVTPYYKLLGVIAWRPFGLYSRNFLIKLLNIVYPLFIIILLLFNYITNALACRGETEILFGNETVPEIPLVTPIPINRSDIPKNLSVEAQYVPGMNLSALHLRSMTRAPGQDMWDPAYNECKHIFGTFILPSLLHLIAYCIGFYLFRVTQHEGLYVLMEKVFLQSYQQKHLYATMWCFVIVGVIWLLLDMGIFVLYIFAFGPGVVTGFRENLSRQIATCCLMAAGQLVLDLVNVVIIVNYAAQCQLVIHYIRGITQRIEEKSVCLTTAMKEILDVKNTLQRVNSVLSIIVSLCIFVLLEDVMIGVIYVLADENQSVKIVCYRVLRIVLFIVASLFPIIQAARVTSLSTSFKQISLDVRVYGHQTSSQLELDSFLLFVQNANIKPRLFFAPVKSEFVTGLIVLLVFALLLLMHTGAIASQTKLF